MFLTEAEAEARLSDLRRERGRIERAIADLTLFLAIGRQMSALAGCAGDGRGDPAPLSSQSHSPRSEEPALETGGDRSQARREGRLLMEAASAILEEAGRPLHAAEILEGLTLRGLSVPGIDPVAALTTRLWKRSGSDGPFQRLGDAVYALASDPDSDEE